MLSGSAAARVKPLQRRRFDENLGSTGSVDLHAGEERQERVRAHRNDRVVVGKGHIIEPVLRHFLVEGRPARAAGNAAAETLRREGYGEALLHEIEQRAKKLRLARLFVLTTRTSGWISDSMCTSTRPPAPR